MLFHIVIFICDYTFDKIDPSDSKSEQIFNGIEKSQKELLEKIETYKKNKYAETNLTEIYNKLESMVKKEFVELMNEFEVDLKKEQGFSVVKLVRLIFFLLFLFGFLSFLFTGSTPF